MCVICAYEPVCVLMKGWMPAFDRRMKPSKQLGVGDIPASAANPGAPFPAGAERPRPQRGGWSFVAAPCGAVPAPTPGKAARCKPIHVHNCITTNL